VLGSDGIQTQDAFFITSDGTAPYLAIKLDAATLGRLTTLESKTDALDLQDSIHTTSDATNTSLILNLDARLDAVERRYAVKIGPLTTGSSNSAATSYGGNYITTQTISFPSGLFTAAPIVLCNQGASSNSSGHSSIQRVWVSACSASSCDVVISDSQASLNVFIDLLATQG